MSMKNIRSFARTIEKTEKWLDAIQREAKLPNEEDALIAFRAVLHTLRDRLIIDEIAHLGSQLPIYLLGVYFENWKPKKKPIKIKSQEEFVRHISQKLPGRFNPLEVTIGTLNVLKRKITIGEYNDIKSELPEDIENLLSGKIKVASEDKSKSFIQV